LQRLHQEDFCQALGIAPENEVPKRGRPRPGPMLLVDTQSHTPKRSAHFAVAGLRDLQRLDWQPRCARQELLPDLHRARYGVGTALRCAFNSGLRQPHRQDGDENRQQVQIHRGSGAALGTVCAGCRAVTRTGQKADWITTSSARS